MTKIDAFIQPVMVTTLCDLTNRESPQIAVCWLE